MQAGNPREFARGVDPGAHRKAQKAERAEWAQNSFEAVAREWYAKCLPIWASSHAEKVINRLENDVFPWLGSRPIAEVTAPELLKGLRRVEGRGALDTAHRVRHNCDLPGETSVRFPRAVNCPIARSTRSLECGIAERTLA